MERFKVKGPLPEIIENLKTNIEREIKRINKNILKSAFLNFRKSCNLIIERQGGHIKN